MLTQLPVSSSALTQSQVANTVKRQSENSAQPSASTVKDSRHLHINLISRDENLMRLKLTVKWMVNHHICLRYVFGELIHQLYPK